MPPASQLDDCRLVPADRFGVALHRARSQSGETLAALSRATDNRFLPDQLVAVERGEVGLTDDDVAVLVDAYGLGERPWAPASMLDLVLDRAPVTSFVTDRDGHDPMPVHQVAARFVALSVLLGADLTSGAFDVDVLAEALDLSVPEALAELTGALERDPQDIGALVHAMEERVVVPEAGILVGETPSGTLVLVGRSAGAGADAPATSACGRLGDLIEAGR